MRRKVWFKHYNDASQGNSLRLLWDSGDFEAYGFWWQLCEIMSRLEGEKVTGKLTLSWGILRRELGWNKQRCSRVLAKIVQTFEIEVETKSEEFFELLIPKWLEFQENKNKKNRDKISKNLLEERGEKKEERGEKKEGDENAPKALINIAYNFEKVLADLGFYNPGLIPHHQKIYARFPTRESLELWADGLLQAPSFEKVKEDSARYRKFDYALKCEVGILQAEVRRVR